MLAGADIPSPADLGITFVDGSNSAVIVERGGRKYVVDLATHSVRPAEAQPVFASTQLQAFAGSPQPASPQKGASGGAGARIFSQNCAKCHGADGKGIAKEKTPNFTDPKVQSALTEDQLLKTIRDGKPGTEMPAWKDKMSDSDIRAVAAYVRSLGGQAGSQQQDSTSQQPAVASAEGANSTIYRPGDDRLVSLPTGRRLEQHGVYVNFTHRFPLDPTFTGPARGGDLAGLDGFALASFGFEYGVTKNFWVEAYRSPTFIGRPIQLLAAYSLMDERDGRPLNLTVRASIEGRDDFTRQFTENIEGIVSSSLGPHAQIYLVPTASFNNRPLLQPKNIFSSNITSFAGIHSFALGFGAAVDIRPTVALLAEVIPTLANARELGIHRPVFAFGIQKKIWRHAFTLGFTNSPGTTVSQRSGTLAEYTGQPSADTFGGLILGFNLTRQIH